MPPIAVLVLTVVVLVLLAGCLGVVFLVARQPSASARPGNEDPARARQPESGTHRGDMPAGAGGGHRQPRSLRAARTR
jgi:hypothetical protein